MSEAAFAWQLEQRWIEGPHPHRVPQHDLLRPRRLRDPAGGPHVLRGQRDRPRPPAGGAPRRDPARPDALRPAAAPGRGPRRGAGSSSASCSSRERSRRAEWQAAERTALPRSGEHPAAGPGRPGAVLRQLREGPARGHVRRRPRLRRRARGDDDDRPRPAGHRRAGDQEGAARPRGACGRARRDRPAHRRRQGDVRRYELPQEPVQPRDPGRAPARLVVQADRARDGAAARDRPERRSSTRSRSTSPPATGSGT